MRVVISVSACLLALGLLMFYSPLHRQRTLVQKECGWKFQRYLPSAWEAEWTAGVGVLQDRVCAHTDPERSAAWVERKMDSGVFSQFIFVNVCTGEQLVDYIEPLAGLTRHPFFCLKGEEFLVDKSYILVPTSVPRKLQPGRKAYYFDLGASLYDEGAGGASQKWIVESYAARGVRWDGIWSWDAREYSQGDVWRRIPAELKPVYHWYNVAADDGTNNPLEFIRRVTDVEDYVLVKIDIDNRAVEEVVIKELLASDATLARVDELYFEHHVDIEPMRPYWGNVPGASLADTYALFAELRRRGVLAHSWV